MDTRIYAAGVVAVSKGALKVYGSNTEWLANDIKPGDLIMINGNIYEISEVNSSTELTLTRSFKTDSDAAIEYVIIRSNQQVIASDLVAMLYKCINEHNTLITGYGKAIEQFVKYACIIKRMGFYINENGDLAQDETPDQIHAGHDYSNTDSSSASTPISSSSENEEMATDEELHEALADALGLNS